MNWRIGSKVVCVRDGFLLPDCVSTPPKKDQVYVVRAVCDNGVPLYEHVIFAIMGHFPRGLMLREVSNPPCECRGGIERGFDQSAFRPVIEDESKSKAEVENLKKIAREAIIKTPEKVK
jgi:hypothetical protein